MLVMMLIFLVQFARVRFALDHTFIMLRFFKPLTTHEQQEQVKVTAVQAAAAVATAAAAKHQRDLLLPKPGRPRSLVNLVAPSSIPDPEPASKRPKQYKDWFTSMPSITFSNRIVATTIRPSALSHSCSTSFHSCTSRYPAPPSTAGMQMTERL
jgi:hypothetical protein